MRTKKREERAGDKKVSIKKHKFTSSLTRGLRHKKGRTIENVTKVDKMSQEEIYGTSLSIFLSLYPKVSAIASGATPIGSVVAHPIGRSRQKEGEESKLVIKNKLMRFRHNWLHLVGKELRLHCRQNEHRLLPLGVIHES
jgi:hypothetical protein